MNHSHQRDLILNYLKSTTSHPTADTVYQNVKLIEPDISLGTVYRNLKLLSDNKIIQRLHMDDGIDHYDANIEFHNHLYCNNCGNVYDIEMELASSFNKSIESFKKKYSGSVNGYMIYLYGICENCQNKIN